MPDNYAHKYNGQQAMAIAQYTPRSYEAFIWGCNGPDPLYSFKMYEAHRKDHMYNLATRMHNEKTGLFIQNLFRFAQTNAQKDYCLGFLCHYSLDSIIHPYINYVTTAYASPFNRENGHCWFESALDSLISFRETGSYAANPKEYCPEIKKMYLDQIITLFHKAVEATYPDEIHDRGEYQQSFYDFKKVKGMLYSPTENKIVLSRAIELALGMEKGFVACRLQPCKEEIKDIAVWRNNATGFFCTATIDELLAKANQTSADYIAVGLEFFHGKTSAGDLLEDVGNKSYITGVAIE
ncbi:MAG: hypothetical protein E7484_03985 [Ruminococcaceae bacterium]|nr:hypothetical protein [Oscillospiraceae bacterium]